MTARLKRIVRRAAYESGILGAIHRLRNRNHLTVVMFHRVLSPSDPRWAGADPEYTVSDKLFAGALEFFRQHYSIISLSDLFAAFEGASLPPRPLLITLDDGWADTAEYALPALQRLHLPAAVFVAAGAIGRREAFWEERLYAAWRRNRVTVVELIQRAGLHQELSVQSLSSDNSEDALRAAVTALGRAPEAIRAALLASLEDALGEPPHMLSTDQLRLLASNEIAIGIHGYSHVALTDVDAGAELTHARSRLRDQLEGIDQGSLRALSFPHGRYDAKAIRDAVGCGFSLLFTSDPVLTPLSTSRRLTTRLMGRIDIPATAFTTRFQRLDGARLATWLFPRRPARLALDPSTGASASDSRQGGLN